MPDFLSIEELIIDDSFFNYCFQKNEADIFYWEQLIQEYPSQTENIEQAKKIVIGLHVMLNETYTGEKININRTEEIDKSYDTRFSLKNIFRYAAAIAAVFVIILVSRKMFNGSHNTSNESKDLIASNTIHDAIFSYKTDKGERKKIILSDSTKISLNAASELRVDKGFGKENRNVYLIGEALFDVTHNESLPFIVHTDKYKVKDLGTVFNVKVYPGDKHSETSLIKGKVEIQFANTTGKISLLPNQKAVVTNNNDDESPDRKKQTSANPLNTQVVLVPLSHDKKDSTVIETAWAQNRLEILNENFYEMKDKLERWFNVKISIKGEVVGKYPFTATFEKENIQEVLQALQYAYHFNYKIENNEINISK